MIDVSVVVPTRGRQSLASAVASALGQTGVSKEIIVVDASGECSASAVVHEFEAVQYVSPRRPLTAGAARWEGCQHSRGRWIALLDDDDVFRPEKLMKQVAVARKSDSPALVSSDYLLVPYSRANEADSAVAYEGRAKRLEPMQITGPPVRPKPGEPLVEYLFRRRTLRSRRRLVTSSFLVDGELGRSTPWHDGLRRFEDWHWLMSLYRQGVAWTHVPEPLVLIGTGAPHSLSAATTNWSDVEVHWPLEAFPASMKRELGDVLMCDIAVAVAAQCGLRRGFDTAALARRTGRPGLMAQLRFIIEVCRQAVLSLSALIHR